MIYGNRFYAFETKVDPEAEMLAEAGIEIPEELPKVTAETSIVSITMNDTGLLEAVSDYYFSLTEGTEEVLEEGANKDYVKIFKENFKKYRQNIKDANSACSKKGGQDFDKAKKLYLEAEKDADKIVSDIKKIKPTIGEQYLGILIGTVCHLLIAALMFLIACIPVVGKYFDAVLFGPTIVSLVHQWINMMKNVVEAKNVDEEIKAYNLHKNNIESAAKFLKTFAKQCAQNCDKASGKYYK